MLNELIDKIVVYQSEIIDGIWVQKIDIYYRYIGADCFMGTNERFFIHKLPVVSTPFEKVLPNLQR